MADNQTTAAEPTNGRVTRVQGSVIDVEFPVGHLPDIYNALKVTIVNTSAKEEGEAKETEITLEVEQHLGDSTVRCVALKPTDGLVRGASVSDTGAPISVPVGDVTKGHVFDVSGNILNKKPDETITVSERSDSFRVRTGKDNAVLVDKIYIPSADVLHGIDDLGGKGSVDFKHRVPPINNATSIP